MTEGRAPRQVGDILGGMLPARTARRLPAAGLLEAWGRAVGELIARRARPVCLEEGGELVVAVTGSVWRQELSLLAPGICADLGAAGWPVSRLKLVIASTPPPPPRPRPMPVALGPEEEEEIQRAFESVSEPGLRRALAGLMRAQLKAEKSGRP